MLFERLQIDIVGREIRGFDIANTGMIVAKERTAQCHSDVAGDLVLDGEHVVECTVIALRPDVKAVVSANQLRRNAYPVAGLLNTALENVCHTQRKRDSSNIDILVLEREGRCTRRHLEIGQLREHMQQCLGQAVGEVLVVAIGAHIDERQYGHRRFVNVDG